MSQQITTAMVDMFSANVMHLSQQNESRLWEHCRQETQSSESKFYDRVGLGKVRRKEGRHSDIVYSDTPHSRRMVTTEDWYEADIVDDEDKLRVIMNPESEYAIAFAAALGRNMDEEIIAAVLGSAFGGKKGTQVIALPDSQKLVAVSAGAFSGLNIETLRRARKQFKQKEAIKKNDKLIFCYAAQQADDLLGTTEVTSADFNSVKALVDGEADTFMGFKFVSTELLPFNSAAVTFDLADGSVGAGAGTVAIGDGRRCMVFTPKRGILFAKAREVSARITELPNKHYANQVYAAHSIGGTRMEEEQVMEVICQEL